MKKITISLFSLLISFLAFAQGNPNEGKITAAMNQSFATQSNQFTPLIEELQQSSTDNTYWIAYTQFYESIYFMHTQQMDQSKASIERAIELMQNKEEMDSEDHALLGYLLGFSISFNPSNAVSLSGKSSSQYRSALKKNENNPRAYLGMGESDFHKPEEYGGGEKVEEYLLKAISLPEQTVENGPSWGKNSAYYTLASFYQRKGEYDKAKMYCMKGLTEFPQDYQLNQLKASL